MLGKLLTIISIICVGLLIATIVFIFWEYYKGCEEWKLENWDLKLENRAYKERLEECQKYNLFQRAISKIGKREYSGNYDCLNFTKDLQQELRRLDIESSIFINEGRDHAWLGVWIEATKGQFIGLDNDYKIMEIRKE